MNQAGQLIRDEPYSFVAPAVLNAGASTTPVYGPNASPPTKAVDAILVTVTAAQTIQLVDQNGASVSLAFGSTPFTYLLPISPQSFQTTGTTAANIYVLYR